MLFSETHEDEIRVLRRRLADLEDDFDRANQPSVGVPGVILCKTVTIATYPTVPVAFYGAHAVVPGGTETEGGSPSLTENTNYHFYIGGIGSAVPPTGTNVIAVLADGLWVFKYDG